MHRMNLTARTPLAAGHPPRPAGLRLLSRLLIGSAASGPFFAAIAAGWQPGMDPGDPVAHALRRVALVAVLAGAIPATLLLFGLLRERPWTRPLLLAYVATWATSPMTILPIMPGYAPDTTSVVGAVVCVPLFWWYLYRKPSVVEYYAGLERSA
jgi:hypothetical protein